MSATTTNPASNYPSSTYAIGPTNALPDSTYNSNNNQPAPDASSFNGNNSQPSANASTFNGNNSQPTPDASSFNSNNQAPTPPSSSYMSSAGSGGGTRSTFAGHLAHSPQRLPLPTFGKTRLNHNPSTTTQPRLNVVG